MIHLCTMKFLLLTCLVSYLMFQLSQCCTHAEAITDLDLSKLSGTYVEAELTEDPPTTDCQQYTILYNPADSTILIHGHYYDLQLSKWEIFTVTFDQHATDKTAYVPHVITDQASHVKWKSIESAKVVRADGKHLVWSLCITDGTDMVMIYRNKNYTEDGSSLNELMEEYNKIPKLSKFHATTDSSMCEKF